MLKAIYLQFNSPRVLDFGAGRGGWTEEQRSVAVRKLQDLRNGAGEVVAADVDGAVLQNKCSHQQVVIPHDGPLPFESSSFDIVVADYVFEHIKNPQTVVSELLRVLRPGGWVAARTPSRFGYIALGARLLPNRLHSTVLKFVQPARKSMDVFPTAYKLNSNHDIQRHFSGQRIVVWSTSAEPWYHFNSKVVFRFLQILQILLPKVTLCVFVQKQGLGDAEFGPQSEAHHKES